MSDATVLDRLFDALAVGDLIAATACFTPDAKIRHSFDRLAQSPAEAAVGWAAMIDHFPERGIADKQCQATATGFVQQHLWTVRSAVGKRMAWPVCVVVRIRDGLIVRLDEYLDRAGSFDPEEAISAHS